MMLLPIVAGLLFLASIRGQQDICNYDPDLIFFDNSQLEKLRKSILAGECSPPTVGWKMQVNDAEKGFFRGDMENDDLSDQDRGKRNGLVHVQTGSEERRGYRVRFPEDTWSSNDFFESDSHQSPYQHVKTKSNGFRTLPNRKHRDRLAISRLVYPSSRTKRQIQRSDLFGSQIEIQPRFFDYNKHRLDLHNNFFTPNTQNQKNKNDIMKDQRSPQSESSKSSPNNFQKSTVIPTDQRRWKDPNLFVPNIRNVLGDVASPEDFFRPIESAKRQQLSKDKRIQHNQRPVLDLNRPNDQTSSGTNQNSPNRQRRPNNARKPSNQGVPPVLQRPQTTTLRNMEATTLPGPPTWPTAPSLCVQRCPNTPEYNPVCGSDRITYVNPGRLRCEQQCGKANVNLNYYGTCGTTTTELSSSTPTSITTPTTIRRTTSRSRNVRTTPRLIQ